LKKIACIVLFAAIVCFSASCGTINKENLKKLKCKDFKNYTLYYVEEIPVRQIKDYDTIVDNMYNYLAGKMGFNFNKPHFNLAILPIENDVVQFKKRDTNACTDYENIYLIDMFNLGEEIYQEYGEPPEGIANDAFSHELAHLMTNGIIDFKKKNKIRPDEMHAVSFSFIDFTTTEFKLRDDIEETIKANISEEHFKSLNEDGLVSLKNASTDRSLAVFLLYLHVKEDYGKIITFLEAESVEDFIKKVNWGKTDDESFLKWLSEYIV
jgi:hypothetical protein